MPQPQVSDARQLWSLLSSRRSWPAWTVLLVALVATAWGTRLEEEDAEAHAAREFAFAAGEVKVRVEERLLAHEQVLRAGAGLFDASSAVERAEWRGFVGHLALDARLPGIQGVGYAEVIQRGDLQAHLAAVRAEGFPDYTVRPAGDRPVYTSIVFLEPFAGRNLRAFGYDMFSEPVRRAAMERARDEDAASLSGKVILVQELSRDVQFGTLLYVPVYRHGAPTATVAQRRAALQGWVYSPYRMRDLMRGILGSWATGGGQDIHLRVYDGPAQSAASLLYDSAPTTHAAKAEEQEHVVLPIAFGGRTWTLTFRHLHPPPHALDEARRVLAAGLGGSTLLFALALSLLLTTKRARAIAAMLTTDLRQSEAFRRGVLHALTAQIAVLDQRGTIVDVNDAWSRAAADHGGEPGTTGLGANYLRACERALASDPDGSARAALDGIRAVMSHALASFELEYQCEAPVRDRWFALRVTRTSRGGAEHVVVAHHEITAMKAAEQGLRDSLREKDSLVMEVHHRVKNNLQVMVSLLGLQLEQTGPECAPALRDSQERIRSMALIHEQLYQSPDVSRIDLAAYARSLTLGLVSVYANTSSVRVDVEADELWLGVDTAIPCGLILNELVSNALKYAFPDGRAGRVRVALSATSGEPGVRELTLTVRDDGVGLPESLDVALNTTLGLRLVHILAKQLRGTVAVHRGGGAHFEVTVREKEANRS